MRLIPIVASVVLVLFIIIAVLVISNNPVPDAQPETLPENVGETELSETPAQVNDELIETEAQVTTEVQLSLEEPATAECAYGDNFEYEVNALDVTFRGGLYDSATDQPIPDQVIDVICDDEKMELVGVIKTDENGMFDFTVPHESCSPGGEAWLRAEYNENECDSEHITLPEEHLGGGGGGFVPFTAPASSNPAAGMPEFSFVTLTVTVVLAGLGLAYLRKR